MNQLQSPFVGQIAWCWMNQPMGCALRYVDKHCMVAVAEHGCTLWPLDCTPAACLVMSWSDLDIVDHFLYSNQIVRVLEVTLLKLCAHKPKSIQRHTIVKNGHIACPQVCPCNTASLFTIKHTLTPPGQAFRHSPTNTLNASWWFQFGCRKVDWISRSWSCP